MNHVYKSIELTGSSSQSLEQAIANAVAKASKTVHNLRWFQITDTRGEIRRGKVAHWQVTMKMGFTLEARMKTLAAGAGQIGVTSDSEHAKSGHEVTVIAHQAKAGDATS